MGGKTWSKVQTFIGIAAIVYAVMFVLFNSTAEARVWLLPFFPSRDVPTFVVILVTALLTLLVSLNFKHLRRLFGKK